MVGQPESRANEGSLLILSHSEAVRPAKVKHMMLVVVVR